MYPRRGGRQCRPGGKPSRPTDRDFLEPPKPYKAGCGSRGARPADRRGRHDKTIAGRAGPCAPPGGVIPALGQEAGTAAAGRKLALEVCASCHVVAADQARAPVLKPPAPGFSEIAARPDLTEASVRRFLAETHGETRRNSAMPAFLLPGLQIDAVVAYSEPEAEIAIGAIWGLPRSRPLHHAGGIAPQTTPHGAAVGRRALRRATMQEANTPRWRLDGVRVVHANELDINTPQTPA